MRLDQIAEFVARSFNLEKKRMLSDNRAHELVKARHIYRVIATTKFGFTPVDVGKYESVFKTNPPTLSSVRSSVYQSRRVIIKDRQFSDEYDDILFHIKEAYPDPIIANTEISTDDNGIVRVTQAEFDERFYSDPKKINPHTGLNWFPSFTFLKKEGAPVNKHITDYHKNKGWSSEYDFWRAEVKGSYVHQCIEDMGKLNVAVTIDQIHRAFTDPQEARHVKRCLKGWLNFVEAEEPIVVSFEEKMIGEDFGMTVDLRCRLRYGGNKKSPDNYENIWTVDFKTSKAVFEDHKIQSEVYRSITGDDRAAVLLLGNHTSKMYTFSEAKRADRDKYMNMFNAWKATAYVNLLATNRIKPRENDMPDEFTLKGSKLTRSFV